MLRRAVRASAGAPWRRLGLLGCAVMAGLLWPATPAWAHAVLLDTEPRAGDVVEGAPAAVVLVFNEPMQQPATVVVSGPEGETVAEGTAGIDGERVIMPLEGITSDGVHTVAWRAVSADDHPLAGEFTFEIVHAADSSHDEEPEPTPTPTPAPEPDPAPPAAGDDTAAAAASDDAGTPGVLAWLLGAAAVLAVLGAAGAVLVNRGGQAGGS